MKSNKVKEHKYALMMARDNNEYDIRYPDVVVAQQSIDMDSDNKMYFSLLMGDYE